MSSVHVFSFTYRRRLGRLALRSVLCGYEHSQSRCNPCSKPIAASSHPHTPMDRAGLEQSAMQARGSKVALRSGGSSKPDQRAATKRVLLNGSPRRSPVERTCVDPKNPRHHVQLGRSSRGRRDSGQGRFQVDGKGRPERKSVARCPALPGVVQQYARVCLLTFGKCLKGGVDEEPLRRGWKAANRRACIGCGSNCCVSSGTKSSPRRVCMSKLKRGPPRSLRGGSIGDSL